MQYEIVSGSDIYIVKTKVDSYLRDGWELYGQLIVTSHQVSSTERAKLIFTQALVLSEGG